MFDYRSIFCQSGWEIQWYRASRSISASRFLTRSAYRDDSCHWRLLIELIRKCTGISHIRNRYDCVIIARNSSYVDSRIANKRKIVFVRVPQVFCSAQNRLGPIERWTRPSQFWVSIDLLFLPFTEPNKCACMKKKEVILSHRLTSIRSVFRVVCLSVKNQSLSAHIWIPTRWRLFDSSSSERNDKILNFFIFVLQNSCDKQTNVELAMTQQLRDSVQDEDTR